MPKSDFRIIEFHTGYGDTTYEVCLIAYGLNNKPVTWEPVKSLLFSTEESVRRFIEAGNRPVLICNENDSSTYLTEKNDD